MTSSPRMRPRSSKTLWDRSTLKAFPVAPVMRLDRGKVNAP